MGKKQYEVIEDEKYDVGAFRYANYGEYDLINGSNVEIAPKIELESEKSPLWRVFVTILDWKDSLYLKHEDSLVSFA